MRLVKNFFYLSTETFWQKTSTSEVFLVSLANLSKIYVKVCQKLVLSLARLPLTCLEEHFEEVHWDFFSFNFGLCARIYVISDYKVSPMSLKQHSLCGEGHSRKNSFFVFFFIFLKFLPNLSEVFLDFWQKVYGRVVETIIQGSSGTSSAIPIFWKKIRFGSIFLSRTSLKFFRTLSKRFFDLWQKIMQNCRNSKLRVRWKNFRTINCPGRNQFFSLSRSFIDVLMNYRWWYCCEICINFPLPVDRNILTKNFYFW